MHLWRKIIRLWFFISLLRWIYCGINEFIDKFKKKSFDILYNNHSLSWKKLESDLFPTLLDIISDLFYIIFNPRKWFKFIISFIIFLFVLFIFSIFPLIYVSVYSYTMFILISIIFLSYILKCRLTIKCNPSIWKVNSPSNMHQYLILSPYRHAIMTLYILKKLQNNKKLPLLDGCHVLSILLFECPLWLVYYAWIFTESVVSVLFSKMFWNKSWIGKIRTMTSALNETLLWVFFKIWLKLENFGNDRKIIVKNRTIYLNGSLELLIKNSEVLADSRFLIPVKVFLNNEPHLAFKYCNFSNLFIIFTSTPTIAIQDGKPEYKCLRFGYGIDKKPQYFAVSYIDLNNTKVVPGISISVAANNGLFDYGMLSGQIIKLNLVFKFYKTNQILFQDNNHKYMASFEQPLPLENLYNLEVADSIRMAADAAQKSIENKLISPEIADRGINEMISLDNNTVFQIAKKTDMLTYDKSFHSNIVKLEQYMKNRRAIENST